MVWAPLNEPESTQPFPIRPINLTDDYTTAPAAYVI